MAIVIHPRPFNEYVQALNSRVPFAMSRWGDGEWKALLGHQGSTCDGQTYSKALRRALTDVLGSRPTYEVGMSAFAVRRYGDAIERYLQQHGLSFHWTNADVFASASRESRLAPLVAALYARTVILIGPKYLSALKLFPVVSHVVVPEHEAFNEWPSLRRRSLHTVELYLTTNPVVAISAGPVAKLLVHALASACPCATVVDFGSVWDPYAGRITRTYHKAIQPSAVGSL